MTRVEAETELCALLDDEALRLLALALRGVCESQSGYGTVEILVSNRKITYVNFSTRMKVILDHA